MLHAESLEGKLNLVIPGQVEEHQQHCPTICLITVAMAAPLVPIRGIPDRPKIRIGSRIRFTIEPPMV
jgi:hypothetical protein